MELAKIYVSESCAQVISKKPIPAGLVGGYIDVVYAEDLWADLSKTVVFRSNITRDVVTDGRRVPVPADVLAAGVRLWVGFFGVAGDKALPTFWASLGTVGEAADPSGDESTDPNLPVWAQILDKTAELEQKVEREYQPKGDYLESSQLQPAIDTALAQAKESGAFDGPEGPPGKDGADGAPGKDGIDGQDGAPGKDGIDGQDGAPGKSAYEYAKDGGYTGTEEEFAAKLAAENPGGADWNAAEGQPGYVNNRTHWVEAVIETILPQADFPVSSGWYDDQHGTASVEPGSMSSIGDFVAGRKYLVKFNGTDYECIGTELTYSGETVVGIGNPWLIEETGWGDTRFEDNGLPFWIEMFAYDGSKWGAILYEQDATISLEIKSVYEEVHKLHEKFLPEVNSAPSDWNAEEGEPGYIKNKPSALGGVTSWNDLEDKPFGSHKETVEFTYDEENPNNIVRESGETIYFVSDKYIYWDDGGLYVTHGGPEDNLTVENSDYYWGTDIDGNECTVRVFEVSIVQYGSWMNYPYVVFDTTDNYVFPVTIDYNGESITFAEYGWYVAGNFYGPKVRSVYTEEITTIDEKYLPETEPQNADWNASEGQPGHVLNRTHWVETVTVDPTFDGDMTGRESFMIEEYAYAVKITDYVPSEDECIGAIIDTVVGDYDYTYTVSGTVDVSSQYGIPAYITTIDGVTGAYVIVIKETSAVNGITISSGTYYLLVNAPGQKVYTKRFSALDGKINSEIVHKIQEKFLPSIAAETPFIDLVALGMPAVGVGGGGVSLADASAVEQLKAIMEKGAFMYKALFSVGEGMNLEVKITATPFSCAIAGLYQATAMCVFNQTPLLMNLAVEGDEIVLGLHAIGG